jgi:DNA-binding NarL/FixJ family response regulator
MFAEGLEALIASMKISALKVSGIANSLQDLERMMHFAIDLLIIELSISDHRGASILADFKKINPGMRIIVLSSYGSPTMVREAFVNGADGYVMKNHHSLELWRCIDKVTAGETYLAEGLRLTPELNKQASPKSEKNYRDTEDSFLIKQKLTKREREILGLIVQFKNNKAIGQELYISDQTVSAHRKRIMKKLGVNNSVNLIKFSMDHHLV